MRLAVALLAAFAGLCAAVPAHAQLPGRAVSPIKQDQPVTFTADEVSFDQENNLVIASGHVEAWQNDHVLRADRVVFDRNTNVAAATGHVVLMEPTGETLFADYAELSEGMKDGVLKGMSALLAENGRLVANGARRTDGAINELSRVTYTTCNLCAEDPTKPPLWQIRALAAVQDTEAKKVEYYDAVMEMYGVPIAYFPYVWHVDPSVKRASGLLIPTIGYTSTLGAVFAQPYYWVIDDQQDMTLTPELATKKGGRLEVDYRLRLNEGSLSVLSSIGSDNGFGGHIFARGRFSYDETWRYGFDINRATSVNYLQDYRVSGLADVLTSQVYLEGFGQGSYARLDSRFYQSILSTVNDAQLPVVLPRFKYSYFGQQDDLGGRTMVDLQGFNVLRQIGTNTDRLGGTINWERPFTGLFGDLWKFTLNGEGAGYYASQLNQAPNWSPYDSASTGQGLGQAALEVRVPMVRDAGSWGTQLIEPIVQLVGAPKLGVSQLPKIPNEDALDLEFTDTNLFTLNRFPGIDRLESGARANVGVHGAWYLGGTTLDTLVGQVYRAQPDTIFAPGTGLNGTVSDIVARASLVPVSWFDLTYRTRIDHTTGNIRMADTVGSIGTPAFRVTAGYLYTTTSPYAFYDQPPAGAAAAGIYTPRSELTLNLTSQWGQYKFIGYARRDLQTSQMVAAGLRGLYENECFIFDVRLDRRYTSVGNEGSATYLLFQLTFKTVGTFGYHAL